MVAYTFEKLLFNYWKLNAESYDKLPEYSEKRYIPEFILKDWNKFKSYTKTHLVKKSEVNMRSFVVLI